MAKTSFPSRKLFSLESLENAEGRLAFASDLKAHGFGYIDLSKYKLDIDSFQTAAENFFALDEEFKADGGGDLRLESGKLVGYVARSGCRENLELHHNFASGNIYPSPNKPENFVESGNKLVKLLDQVGDTCITALSEFIGVDPQMFVSLLRPQEANKGREELKLSETVLRLCNYHHEEAGEDHVLFEDHVDVGFVTLALVSANPCLEIMDENGEWYDVETGADRAHLVVMIGELLTKITKDYFPATRHRVVRPKFGHRVSMPFLVRPMQSKILQLNKYAENCKIKLADLDGISIRELQIFLDFKKTGRVSASHRVPQRGIDATRNMVAVLKKMIEAKNAKKSQEKLDPEDKENSCVETSS